MDRRQFNSVCTVLLAGALNANHARANAGNVHTSHPASKLVYEDDSEVTLDSLEIGKAYIFSYPYVTTPCFLVRLDKVAPAKGSWPGGVGEAQSVVAFSAICSHKMSHPAKPISHISYRHETISFHDSEGIKHSRAGLISCCSERSVYDPADGAAVLAGPAPSPLAGIALQQGAGGKLSAVGSFGPDQYAHFLEKFGFRLAMEYGVSDVRARAGEVAVIVPAEKFSSHQVLC